MKKKPQDNEILKHALQILLRYFRVIYANYKQLLWQSKLFSLCWLFLSLQRYIFCIFRIQKFSFPLTERKRGSIKTWIWNFEEILILGSDRTEDVLNFSLLVNILFPYQKINLIALLLPGISHINLSQVYVTDLPWLYYFRVKKTAAGNRTESRLHSSYR